jgi:hypothetical protein
MKNETLFSELSQDNAANVNGGYGYGFGMYKGGYGYAPYIPHYPSPSYPEPKKDEHIFDLKKLFTLVGAFTVFGEDTIGGLTEAQTDASILGAFVKL